MSKKVDTKIRLLYIDDEKENLIGFKYMFRDVYDLSLAQSATEALEILAQREFDVIISDQRMPDMTGVEFFETILVDHPNTARMILTGYSDFEAIIDAINRGKIYYYFKKPWDENEVKLVISNAVEALHLERELRVNVRRFRDIAESSGDWIWETDQEWRYTYASGNVQTILGYQPQDLLGKTPLELMPEAAVKDYEPLFEELAVSRKPIRDLELVYLSREGQEVHLLTNGVPIFDDGFVGYRGVEKDVSQRLRMEEQLRQADKMNSVGQLASGVAHDFNNQLEGIMGYGELLSAKLKDPVLKRYADSIVKSAQRSADLTAALLAFGRKGKTVSVLVDVNQIIDEALSLLERSVGKAIRINRILDAGEPVVKGDPAQLQNMILNLAINARDAMPDGGEITVGSKIVNLDEKFCEETAENVRQGWGVKVTVTDTGVGMPGDVKKHIFEPFFTTKPKGEGTGLGLSSVYTTARDHGGTVTFASVLGKGTSFYVYLPLVDEVPEPQPEQMVVAQRRAAHVLFVDDEEILREAGQDILTELGYTVKTCVDGAEALDYYRESWADVDLVILDVSMPVLNGVDAYLKMRELNPDIRTILASGYSDQSVASILADGVFFLRKPYRLSEFSAKVAEALGGSPKGATSQS